MYNSGGSNRQLNLVVQSKHAVHSQVTDGCWSFWVHIYQMMMNLAFLS